MSDTTNSLSKLSKSPQVLKLAKIPQMLKYCLFIDFASVWGSCDPFLKGNFVVKQNEILSVYYAPTPKNSL